MRISVPFRQQSAAVTDAGTRAWPLRWCGRPTVAVPRAPERGAVLPVPAKEAVMVVPVGAIEDMGEIGHAAVGRVGGQRQLEQAESGCRPAGAGPSLHPRPPPETPRTPTRCARRHALDQDDQRLPGEIAQGDHRPDGVWKMIDHDGQRAGADHRRRCTWKSSSPSLTANTSARSGVAFTRRNSTTSMLYRCRCG